MMDPSSRRSRRGGLGSQSEIDQTVGASPNADGSSPRTGTTTVTAVNLQLGQVTDSVQVTGESPLLETSTSSVSRNINQRTVQDMPLLARNVLMLVNLAPGVTNNSPTGSSTGLIDIDSVSYTSASGANNRTNEFLMDGIPNNVSDRVAYIPSVDDVDEFTDGEPEVCGFFAGYFYINLANVRMQAVRSPLLTVEQLDLAFFGDRHLADAFAPFDLGRDAVGEVERRPGIRPPVAAVDRAGQGGGVLDRDGHHLHRGVREFGVLADHP